LKTANIDVPEIYFAEVKGADINVAKCAKKRLAKAT